MQKMCGTWYAVLACVIMFLSIFVSVRCLPLDNSPSILHRNSFTSEDDRDSDLADLFQGNQGILNTQSRRTSTTHHNFYWWQVERASGVEAVDTLDREKRFPRIPMNTRCSSDNDCSASHCCAMKLGMAVCRTRPSYGQNCQDWTPLDTDALFTLCPCAQGYTCRRVRGRDVGVCYTSRR